MGKRAKFHKGDLVSTSFRGTRGWRALTESELRTWQEDLRKDIQAGRSLPHDDAGEPHLPPKTKGVEIFQDRIYFVLRGRTRVPFGYSSVVAVEIFDSTTGETIWSDDEWLEHIQEA